ncbi:hypothetical protein BRADI_3g45113v3, partial [Brachypodium distachyon]
ATGGRGGAGAAGPEAAGGGGGGGREAVGGAGGAFFAGRLDAGADGSQGTRFLDVVVAAGRGGAAEPCPTIVGVAEGGHGTPASGSASPSRRWAFGLGAAPVAGSAGGRGVTGTPAGAPMRTEELSGGARRSPVAHVERRRGRSNGGPSLQSSDDGERAAGNGGAMAARAAVQRGGGGGSVPRRVRAVERRRGRRRRDRQGLAVAAACLRAASRWSAAGALAKDGSWGKKETQEEEETGYVTDGWTPHAIVMQKNK